MVAALKVASKMHRSTLVEKTICFCSDLATNQDQILSQLTDWEKLVTKRAFAEAQEQNLLREWLGLVKPIHVGLSMLSTKATG